MTTGLPGGKRKGFRGERKRLNMCGFLQRCFIAKGERRKKKTIKGGGWWQQTWPPRG